MEECVIEAYMRAFLYELEEYLNTNNEDLKNIKFQSDEANTDKELKKYLKDIVTTKCNTITLLDRVIIKDKTFNLKSNAFRVTNVLIPGDYTSDDKNLVKQKKSGVYVNPDMILNITIEGENTIQYVELKSTKDDKIPGSSVQQIVPNEWVIFVRHNPKETKLITGQYKNSISGTMQFPDRSPRPQVSYKELLSWIDTYRVHVDRELEIREDEEESNKEELLNDWQGVLSKRWINVLKSNKKNKEPWFNNNLRKFAVDFIKYYESLSYTERQQFLDKIEKNIED